MYDIIVMSFSNVTWNYAIPSDSNTDLGGAMLKVLVDDHTNRGLDFPNYQLIEWSFTPDSNSNFGFLLGFCTDSNFDVNSSNTAIVGSHPSNNFYWAEDGQITTNGMYIRLGYLSDNSNNYNVLWDSNVNFIEGFSNVVGTNFWNINGILPQNTDFLQVYGDTNANIMSLNQGLNLLEINNANKFGLNTSNANYSLSNQIIIPNLSNSQQYFIREFSSTCTALDMTTHGFFAYPTIFSDPANVSALSPQAFRYSSNSTSNMGFVQSFTLPITPPPGQPTNVSVTPGDSQVSISWSTPLDGGIPLSYNVISFSINDSTTTTTSVSYPSTSCIVSGLTNYWPYTFTVIALNATGNSIASVSSSQVTPTPATPPPGQPSITSVEAGNAKIRLYWTPSLTGGTATGYVITATPSSGTTLVFNVNSTPTNTIITGLTNEISYILTISGTNGGGTGIPSTQSSMITPSSSITTPGPVASCSATAGDGQITVSWTAPQSGGLVNNYIITATPASGGNSTNTTVPSSYTNTYITGLQNGTAYIITVVASNIEGQSSSVSPNTTITPVIAAPPDSVISVNAIPGDSEISVTWVPASTGVVPDHYYVIAIDESHVHAPSYVEVSYPFTTGTITGLSNGTTYDVEVIAVNGQNASQPTTVTSLVPITSVSLPGQPTNVSGTPGNGYIALSWNPPNSGGIPSTYTVTATPATGTPVTFTFNYPDTTDNLVGLTNGVSYTITVTANNSAGSGPVSTSSASITPESTPNVVSSVSVVSVTNNSVTISWVPDLTGGNIDGYLVYAVNINGSPFTVNSSTTTMTISGLSANATYNNIVFVEAYNSVSNSGPVFAPTFTTNPNLPGAVSNVTAVPGNNSATVNWSTPSTGGTPATYSITATPTSGSIVMVTVNFPTISTVVSNLVNGTAYTFTVVARNISGSGAPSTSSSITPQAPPNPVSSVSIDSVSSTSVTISWIPDNTGGIIYGYIITAYTIAGSPFTTNSSTTQMTISGLASSTTYNGLISVQSENAIATSSAVYAPSFTTHAAIALPGQPIGVTATAGDGGAYVGWTAPVSGGTPDNYTVVALDQSGNQTSTIVAYPNTLANFSELTNGLSYTFTVTATNLAGSGPTSATSSAVVPENAPNPVQSISVVSVDNYSVTLSWVPDFTGGVIEFYYVTAPTIVGSPFVVASPATSGTFTGFQIGTTYHHFVTVTAANTIASSTPVYAPDFTTLTTPGPVSYVVAVPGNATITVTWSDQVLSGTPSSYYVSATSSSGVSGSAITGFITNRLTQSAVVSGLTNNAPYTCTVTPMNSAGSGDSVSSVGTVTPEATPNPVLSVSVVAVGDGFVTLSWVPDTSGGIIQTFNVTFPGILGSPFIINYPTTEITISGLSNGTTYTTPFVFITAANTISSSSPVYAPTFTPMQPPSQVTQLNIIAGDASGVLSWTPAISGGQPSIYTIAAVPLNGATVTTTVSFPASSATITGLTNLLSYIFTVTAINAAGSAATVNGVSIKIGLSGPVRSVTATPGDSLATIYWTGSVTGGTPNYYLVTATPYSGTTVSTRVNYPLTTLTMTGLVNGTTYIISIMAVNAAGNSASATAIQPVTPFSNSVSPGAGGDPHIITIYGEHYILPNEIRNVNMLTAVDKNNNIYNVSATTRFMSIGELRDKKAFCITRKINRNIGYVMIKEIQTLDYNTILKLKELSCFDKFIIRYNKSVVTVDGFSGKIIENIVNNEIYVEISEELMKTSTGESYYPRTNKLRSYNIKFGNVVAHISVDDTYADINYVRFDMNDKLFLRYSGAIITKMT